MNNYVQLKDIITVVYTDRASILSDEKNDYNILHTRELQLSISKTSHTFRGTADNV